jgi:GTP-binding protein
MTIAPEHIRNLAIVAHIDHGKTTLIDSIFRAAHTFRDNARVDERVMDSNVLEKERGITIRAKHCSVEWRDPKAVAAIGAAAPTYRFNIIDTPGHADFSGEVERVLSMVDSVILIVDANEGPMPQTRYVLMRALDLGMKPLVFVNKVDRPQADPNNALSKTFDLFLELGATDNQADFVSLYGSGLSGWASDDPADKSGDTLDPLFRAIVEHVPCPTVDLDAPFRMQVCSLAWSDYIGRYGCGRVLQGRHRLGDALRRRTVHWSNFGDEGDTWDTINDSREKSTKLWTTHGLENIEVEQITAGDIVWIATSGDDIHIGDTLDHPDTVVRPLAPLDIEEPTVSMFFLVNDGPFCGEEGRAVTVRELRARLDKELHTNIALRVEDIGRADGLKVSGRGELHLAILVEEMRREGMELCVSSPEVITQEDANGKLQEPMELLVVDVPTDYQGVIMESLARRKGELRDMQSNGTGMTRLEYEIPTRGLIGYRTEFLTDTRGLGIMASRFHGYGPWRGDVSGRSRGAMVSMETGEATSYSLENLQERGTLFVGPMERIYNGMIVGENSRPFDMPCKPTKKKAVTNHRSATKEITTGLKAVRRLNLDQALEWIAPDELVEVTPESIRLRKAILDAEARKRYEKRMEAMSASAS